LIRGGVTSEKCIAIIKAYKSVRSALAKLDSYTKRFSDTKSYPHFSNLSGYSKKVLSKCMVRPVLQVKIQNNGVGLR